MNEDKTLREAVEELREARNYFILAIGESLHIFRFINWASKKLGE
jgi:DNA-binding MurR/RpiR family transcriptional regulator